jgi:tripartite-type tricarboxylate transporter receptor subunit TctC
MNHIRRRFLTCTAAGVAAASLPAALRAQPRVETMRILCGYPPGGSIDVVSRKLADRLGGRLARTALVENRPGGAGRTVVDEVKKAPADGSVLLVTPASVLTMYPHIYRSLSYDVFADLAPVSTVAATAFAFAVGPRVPASVTGFEEFVRWCKANPVSAQCANAGAGSMPHFMAMLLARDSGIEFTHVPYRGGLLAMQDVAAGQVTSALATESAALALEQAGKLRVLATSGAERSAFFPRASTFRELALPALEQREWFGVFAPARTPTMTVEAVAEVIRTTLPDADAWAAWHRIGLSIDVSTPAQLQSALRHEYEFWAPIVKASGFTPEA